MTDKHTPGPWTFYTEPQPNGCPIVGSRGLMVAMLAHSVNYPDQKEEALANARLLAAAPEMLEALKLLMTAHGEQLDLAFQTAQEAISKATGVPWPDA